MEISTKKLVAIVIVVSFVTSSFAGLIFGFAGSVASNKYFPRFADDFLKNLEQLDKNIRNKSAGQEGLKGDFGQSGNDEASVESAVKKASPAVVSIIISKDLPKIEQYNPFDGNSFFEQFFGQGFNIPQYRQNGTEKKEIGGGTGFIITSDGLIVTNKHVVSDKEADYTVLTNDEKKYPAKVLGLDPVNDLAIIKIDQKNLPTVILGDSGNLEVGQTVITIGNALGEFTNTAGAGIISGLRRSIVASGSGAGEEQLRNIIQTDATINPGNSGGPLLNIKGEVIGVNVAMAQGAENIGFAIPINDVKKIINEAKTKGKIVTPSIGVRYIMINGAIKEKNNLSVDYGALVARGSGVGELAVVPGSPADKAGIQENDIILEVNGVKADNKNPLMNLINAYSVGDQVTLKILHKGERKEVKVKLEEKKIQQ